MVERITIQNQKGFSIIELLIVFLFIGIIATASIPMIQKNLELYRTETAVRLISSRLMEAKLVAIKWNRTSSLELNPADNSVVIRTTDNSGNQISVSTMVFLPAESVIDSGSTVSVAFTSLGRNQSVGGTTIPLNFPRTSQCRDINVSASGKVTVVACTLDP